MKTKWHASKKIRFILTLGLLIAGSVLYYACGENRLPPPGPSPTGTIIITEGAV